MLTSRALLADHVHDAPRPRTWSFRPIRRRLTSLLCICLWATCWSLSATTQLEAEEPQPTPAKDVRTVPEAFSRAVPVSVVELREIEDHLKQLVPRLTPCTVNLRIGRAQGSGVIVTPEGIILSAAHVTGPPGKKVIVTTSDGKQYDGISLGRNTTLDASMVQIQSNRNDWPSCPLSKEEIEIGDWCATLGHPGGYMRERGMVLRLGRIIERNDWLVQTDCELIGGDSGGPLFNMQGEVIGINTRIGESTDYNFHVPRIAFSRDWDRLLASEDFKSHSGAYLGLGGRPADSGEGLLIQTVEGGTPADRAGLKTGDVLLTFQEHKVKDLEQLTKLVGDEFPGRTVKLTILRDGQTEEISTRLGMRWNR